MRTLLELTAALAAVGACAAAAPNVVLIVSDDHGWTDYGFMGHRDIRTPHIDKLAAESLLFTRGYVPSSLCRPSLASMMTGLYPHQHGITGNDPPGNARDAANRAGMVEVYRRSPNLAGLLGDAGHVSFQSGKWWEGDCTCCGFTECMTHGQVARGGRHGDEGLKIGRQTMQPLYDFIDKAGDKPFFLWYAPMMPHTPHNPAEQWLRMFESPERAAEIARYYAMVAWFDHTVGELLAYLDRKGLARNTVVVYLADNGWIQLAGARPLFETRAKLSPYDAGVRTPVMVRWPGKIAPRRDERTLVSSVDVAPAILRAAGLQPPPAMVGVDLSDRAALERRKAVFGSIFVHTSIDIARPEKNLKYRWVVRERLKLISPYRANLELPLWENQPARYWGAGDELYDVVADPGEKKNLAAERPDQVRQLLAELDRWWRVTGSN